MSTASIKQPDKLKTGPLPGGPPKTGFWNGRTIQLNPQLNTILKITAIAIILLYSLWLLTTASSPTTNSLSPAKTSFWPEALGVTVLGTGMIAARRGCFDATCDQALDLFNKGLDATCSYALDLLSQEEAQKNMEQELANPLFLQLLFSLKAGAPRSKTFLRTIANFIKVKGQHIAQHQLIIKELRQAAKKEISPTDTSQYLDGPSISKHRELDYKVTKIYENVTQKNLSQLLSVSSITNQNKQDIHAVGVRFFQDPTNGDMICSIFNSGYGLEFHDRTPTRGKYDLQTSWKIPRDQFTKELIELLIDPSISVENRYHHCDTLQGAERLHYDQKIALGFPIRGQTPQEGGTCTLEWIFAYLKYAMPLKDYYEMRKTLCEAAVRAALKDPETRKIILDNWDSIAKIIERKRAKATVAAAMDQEGILHQAYQKTLLEVALPMDKQEGESQSRLCLRLDTEMRERVKKEIKSGRHQLHPKEFGF